jgi:hypothetical protein
MTPSIVIAALQDGTATAEQVDWANRRVSVLTENAVVFGLSAQEQQELDALFAALDVDWDGGPSLDEPDDLSN